MQKIIKITCMCIISLVGFSCSNENSPNISPHSNPPTFHSNTGFDQNGGEAINKEVDLDKEDIQKVQTYLKGHGYLDRVSGIVDTETRDAVRSFQKANNLIDSGTLNAQTMKKMGISYNEATGEGRDVYTE